MISVIKKKADIKDRKWKGAISDEVAQGDLFEDVLFGQRPE